jgi:hypothetical protein
MLERVPTAYRRRGRFGPAQLDLGEHPVVIRGPQQGPVGTRPRPVQDDPAGLDAARNGPAG